MKKIRWTRRHVAPLALLMVVWGSPVGEARGQDGTVNPTEVYSLQPNFDPNARPRRTPKNQRVTLDFNKTSLEEVVKMFSSIMGQNFMISDSVNTSKTITIMSPKAVTITQAYQAFLMALQQNGLTVVKEGAFLKIVDAKNAPREPIRIRGAEDPIPNEARMMTVILPVERMEVAELMETLQNFLTNDAKMIARGNNILLTETGTNIRRIKGLIRRLDQSGSSSKVFVYKVNHASAQEIATKLKEVFSIEKGSSAKKPPTGAGDSELSVSLTDIISDERTNQLIIVSDRKSFDKVRDMIELLDVPTAVGGQIHVKFLEYADADELSGTLSSLANSSNTPNPNRGRRGPRANEPASPPGVTELLSGDVQITSYKASNALIIIASPRDYLSLESVIDKLDRPRKQVYIEAVIMEVGIDTNRELGLGVNAGIAQEFKDLIPQEAIDSGLVKNSNGLIVGSSNYKGLGAALGSAGGALGLVGPMVTIPGTTISLPAIALLLKAIQTDNTANILSMPKILTLDNSEAEFMVGERVPFFKGVGSGTGGLASLLGGVTGASSATSGLAGLLGGGLAGGLYSNIEYEDVGINLRILPQVNESGYIRLEVDQEVSDIKGAGGGQAGTPTTTQRRISTTVIAKDQSTIVIGGLMRDIENETVEKVPILGDIPLLGVLFKNKTRIKTKQNLVLMLTPYIIESESDISKIVDRARKTQEELMELVGDRDIEYYSTVNYEKKTGLLERIRSQVSHSLVDAEARRLALESFEESGPGYHVLGEKGEGKKEGTSVQMKGETKPTGGEDAKSGSAQPTPDLAPAVEATPALGAENDGDGKAAPVGE